MFKSFSIVAQYWRFQHLCSRIVGRVANCQWAWFKNWAIRRFIRKYQIDIDAALSAAPNDYPNFNQFFIRQLKPGARPIVQGRTQIASPADGAISQIGQIKGDLIFQAKDFHFSLDSLFGGLTDKGYSFQNGAFATIYLAPRDYHRVHMPIAGQLKTTIFVPGKLFSVNSYTTLKVPNLFARNERLICLFDTEFGPMAVILVGAMLVGSIHTSWQANFQSKTITATEYQGKIHLARGAELGYFSMGSTVIVLFGANMRWAPQLRENSILRMGELIGEFNT